MNHKRIVLGLSIFFMVGLAGLAFIGSPARAQDNPQTVELVGQIEDVTDTTITVNQVAVDISGAEIEATLEVGTWVEVEGILQSDGSIVATEVNAAGQGEHCSYDVQLMMGQQMHHSSSGYEMGMHMGHSFTQAHCSTLPNTMASVNSGNMQHSMGHHGGHGNDD